MAVQVSDSIEQLAAQWKEAPYQNASDEFVIGEVRLDSPVLLVGEALGEDEIARGAPFVGVAGQRLNHLLGEVGLFRSQLSITNVVPRRPLTSQGKNRKPTSEEISLHGSYLSRLVGLHHNLRTVVLLGGTALEWATGKGEITKYRGQEYQKNGSWYLPTIHPSATLHKPSDIKFLRQDLAWAKRLRDGPLLDTSTASFPYVDDSDLEQYVKPILTSRISYLDIETAAQPPASPLWWWDPRTTAVLISFAWFEGKEAKSVVVDVNDWTLPIIKKIVTGRPQHWAGSAALYFDFPLLRRLGLDPVCERSPLDSRLLALLNNENRSHSVKDLAKHLLGVVGHTPYWGYDEEEQWHLGWKDWPNVPDRKERIRYSGLDAWLGIQVVNAEMERLKSSPHLVKVYKDLLLWQAKAIEEMNRNGLPVNLKKAKSLMAKLESDVAETSHRLIGLVPIELRSEKCKACRKPRMRLWEPDAECPSCQGSGKTVNFNSADQVEHILSSVGFPRQKMTPTGKRSMTDKFALLRWAGLKGKKGLPEWAFQMIDGVLTIRDDVKDKGYVEAVIKFAEISHDGRVHSIFRVGPVSFRITSEDPNCQQWNGRVKELIEAPLGKLLSESDFSGLEVAGLANQSGDIKLIQRIRDGTDLHWAHATGFMGLDYRTTFLQRKEGKNEKIRHAFKTSFFASGYLAGKYKLADTLRDKFRDAGIGVETVLEILEARGVKVKGDPYVVFADEWLKWLAQEYSELSISATRIRESVSRTRVAHSPLAVERRLPEIGFPDDATQSEAHRQAVNFGPQSLSLLTFLAYRQLDGMRDPEKIRLVAQEHDSLVWECDSDLAPAWNGICNEVMPDVDWSEWKTEFKVPLKAEGTILRYWQ